MELLEVYRRRLVAPEFVQLTLEKGWRQVTQTAPAELIPGCCYMAIGLCELTGEILKGGGVYDPEGRWMFTDLDSGELAVAKGEPLVGRPAKMRARPGTGWCFLDVDLGVLLPDKEIFFYKPVPLSFQQKQFNYPWLKFAPM